MTGLTETRIPRSSLPPARMGHVLLIGVAVVVIIVLFKFLVPLFEGPGHVDDLHVVNPTDYDISIAASAPGEQSRTLLGSVDAGDEATFERVVDQGDDWVFHFRTQGRDAGEVERTAEQLEADDWQLRIPASIGERLAADGVPTPQ